jgi:hypothetical protein
MNLEALHKIPHPKFGAHKGPADSCSYPLGMDMSLVLKKESSGSWEFALFERGEHRENMRFGTESEVCAYLLKFAEKNGLQ